MKKLKIHRITMALVLIAVLYTPSHTQETRKIELTAQGILAKVDRILEYPRGQIKGRIKHIKPDGKSYSVNLTGYIGKEDFLFKFSSRNRGEQLKVLYNLGGEDIWVYNIHSLKLFNKLGIDKFDPVLATNFTFTDLSNADLQSNYTATIAGKASVKGREAYKLVLNPISKEGQYGRLTVYVTIKNYIPLRIDYHDRDKAIFKFMTIARIEEKGEGKRKKIIPLRYDMMNIRQGTVTILSFFGFNRKIKFDKDMFRSEKLGGE
ncbi:MAG: outer membrane lipoprotein-sorting protein [bacterium]|nr:outer membrane lipoprotein-sorting protein [bacterium]